MNRGIEVLQADVPLKICRYIRIFVCRVFKIRQNSAKLHIHSKSVIDFDFWSAAKHEWKQIFGQDLK